MYINCNPAMPASDKQSPMRTYSIRFWILDFRFWISECRRYKVVPRLQSKIQNPKSKIQLQYTLDLRRRKSKNRNEPGLTCRKTSSTLLETRRSSIGENFS